MSATEIDSEKESLYELRVIITGPDKDGVYTAVPCNQKGERVHDLYYKARLRSAAIMGALRNVIR